MRPLRTTGTILSIFLALGTICPAQTDPKTVPQPPTAELSKFDPFLGKYEVSGGVPASDSKLRMPGPDVQNLMLGKWAIQVNYSPSEAMPNGGTGSGTEIWRPGPGGLSVIEEYREKNAKGEVEGLGIAWWDTKAQGQRFVWCDNSNPDGCYVSKEVAKWDESSLVWREEQENAGKKRTYSEVFRDITPSSFTQVLQEGEPGEPLKTTVVIRATKLMERSMNEIGASSAERDLRKAMAERHNAMLAGDTKIVEQLTADEYVQTDIFGHVQDKSAWLGEYFRPLTVLMKAGKFRWDVYDEKDVRIQMLGDTAIVVGSLSMKGTGARLAGGTWEEAPNSSIEGSAVHPCMDQTEWIVDTRRSTQCFGSQLDRKVAQINWLKKPPPLLVQKGSPAATATE